MIYAAHTEEHVDGSSWQCYICGTRKLGSLFEYSKSDQEFIETNTKFLDFVYNNYRPGKDIKI